MQAAVRRDDIHPWRFGLVLLAAMTPLGPLAVWVDRGYISFPPVLVTAAVAAVPLLFHARPSGFGWAVGIVSLLLLWWSFVAAMVGMFFFFPSVLQLWLASGADPRRRPVAAKVMVGAGLVLSALTVAHLLGA
ncbi:hypothetical protein ACFC5T_12270 [Streptomyces sp. NPDC055961]|uniref:hypothetical protein n=1 Tax=unclassified Streptomyces TaxID=2593676 RepID=UPI0035E2BAD3